MEGVESAIYIFIYYTDVKCDAWACVRSGGAGYPRRSRNWPWVVGSTIAACVIVWKNINLLYDAEAVGIGKRGR